MAHRVDIRFRQSVAEDDVHKVGNFIEDVWVTAWRQGLVKLEQLDERVNSMKDFGFTFPAKQSHIVLKWVSALVRDHYMNDFVEVVHSKKASADG